MPRPPRADEADGLYHALHRGNGRARIFRKEADYVASGVLAVGLVVALASSGGSREPAIVGVAHAAFGQLGGAGQSAPDRGGTPCRAPIGPAGLAVRRVGLDRATSATAGAGVDVATSGAAAGEIVGGSGRS